MFSAPSTSADSTEIRRVTVAAGRTLFAPQVREAVESAASAEGERFLGGYNLSRTGVAVSRDVLRTPDVHASVQFGVLALGVDVTARLLPGTYLTLQGGFPADGTAILQSPIRLPLPRRAWVAPGVFVRSEFYGYDIREGCSGFCLPDPFDPHRTLHARTLGGRAAFYFEDAKQGILRIAVEAGYSPEIDGVRLRLVFASTARR